MSAIDKLVSEVSTHLAVNNKFYLLWERQQLTSDQVKVFIRNFYAWTYKFPEALASIIFVTDDNLIRAEFTKTLFSEMGHGNHKRIHSVLFKEFANELINKMGGEPDESLFILDETKLLSETLALNSWEKVTYSKNLVSACGAQLAIEWQAYTMIQKLYEGARNYMGFWPEGDAFHEACEYFYSHLGEAEKEHKEESYKASVELLEF